jgi:hypothetical protein
VPSPSYPLATFSVKSDFCGFFFLWRVSAPVMGGQASSSPQSLFLLSLHDEKICDSPSECSFCVCCAFVCACVLVSVLPLSPSLLDAFLVIGLLPAQCFGWL